MSETHVGDREHRSPSALAETIYQGRRKLGLTQKEVEARTGGYLSQNYISQVERGEVSLPSFERLEAFATALQIPLNDLKIAAGYPVVHVTGPGNVAIDTNAAIDLSDPLISFAALNQHLLTPEMKQAMIEMAIEALKEKAQSKPK